MLDKFFKDPDWAIVEKMILDHVQPLLDMTTVDDSLPPDEIKAEIKGRKMAYNSLTAFLRDTGLVGHAPTKPTSFK